LEQFTVLVRIEFKVGVLNQDNVTLRVMQTESNRCALAQVIQFNQSWFTDNFAA